MVEGLITMEQTEQEKRIKAVAENLKDAGCDADIIKRFIHLQETGKLKDSFLLLAKQRKQLLERIHKDQKQLDNFDYLIDKLKKICKNEH